MIANQIKDWRKIRNRILERDNYACRICNTTVGDIDHALNVHHKDWDRGNNKDNNLVTLCRECHHQVHREGYKPFLFEDWPIPWGEDERTGT